MKKKCMVLSVVCYFVFCVMVVPLPPGTNQFAVNNNNVID
jgi:hypothetical protein